MPGLTRRTRAALAHGFALLSYTALSLAYTWPLAARFRTGFLGSPSGDLGAYVWNLWVFRHELFVHRSSPFFTSEILSLTPPTPLTLQNYTAFADVLAMPLLPLLGTVATFNVISLVAIVSSAYAMFVFARARTGHGSAAWLGGAAFGFSSYMMARLTSHLSLALAAPLPVFGLLMYRMSQRPSYRLALLAGLTVAWAFFCDPYYAVYCLLIVLFMVGYWCCTLEFVPSEYRGRWRTTLLDAALWTVAGVVAAIAMSGGMVFAVRGVHVSATTLYTPVLALCGLGILRVAIGLQMQVSVRWLPAAAMRFIAAGALAIVVALAPAWSAFASPLGSPLAANPWPMWRSSAPGVDLVAYVIPNPFHPWSPSHWADWLGRRPNGVVDNAASLSWVVLLTIGLAWWRRGRVPHRGWLIFTGVFAWLALGPFVRVAGFNSFVPTPWALLRYLPLVGAARMPTRLVVLVSLGLSMLFAMAVQQLTERARRPRSLALVIGALLLVELWPAPRRLADARISPVFQVIADDPRPVRVLNLPFGLHDGLGGHGGQMSMSQYQQTLHQKPLAGGYLSRLPPGEVGRYRRLPLMSELLDLSDGQEVSPPRASAAVALARTHRRDLNIGWVVVDRQLASPGLIALADRAFDLELVAGDADWAIYRADP